MGQVDQLYSYAPGVQLVWRNGQLIADNFLLHRSCEIAEDTVTLMLVCAEQKSAAQATTELSRRGFDVDVEEVTKALVLLVEAGVLTTTADRDALAACQSWSRWGPEASYFHFATKDAPYIEPGGAEADYIAELVSGQQPAIGKRYPSAPRLPLPRAQRRRANTETGFFDVLGRRRTVREFDEAAVTFETFSLLCDLSFAPQRYVDAGGFGLLPFRNYANAGARSELEVYANVRRVEDLEAGLYHYNAIDHVLEFMRPELDTEGMAHLSYDQPMCVDAPVSFVITARVDRMGHKYRHSRALRAIYMDAGHLGQSFALIATALDLGPWQTAAFRDTFAEELLGLDGVSETAIYLLGAGVPLQSPVREPTISANRRAAALTSFYEDARFEQR